MSLRIVTHNVRSMADKVKRKQLFNMYLAKKVDIVFLQETHSKPQNAKFWRNEWNGEILYSHGEPNARGVAIMFAKNLEQKILKTIKDEKGRYLICIAKIDDKKVLLCNCYAPNEDSPEFFHQIIQTIQEQDKVDMCIWGGDFNVWLSENDKLGDFIQSHSVEVINEFLQENFWADVWRCLHPVTSHYTWLRKKPISGSRLDYFLIQEGQLDFVLDCTILPQFLSDHSPVFLDIQSTKTIRGKGYWKLNNQHLKNKEYVDNVNKIIQEVKEAKLKPLVRLDVLKNNVTNYSQEFSREKARSNVKKINKLQQKLESQNKKLAMVNLTSDTAIKWIEKVNVKIDTIKSELEKETKIKAEGQILRAKVKWTELAESNTKYFYNLEKSKGKAKCNVCFRN